MKKIFLILIMLHSLYAGTYDYSLDKQDKSLDSFMYGDFDEIIRFDALLVNEDDNNTYSLVLETINKYLNNKKDIKVKIIGHACEKENDADDLSESFAKNIKQKLVDDEINENLLVVESRGSKDKAYTTFLDSSCELSNRVMVTLYVLKPLYQDSDGDGVIDLSDNCAGTLKGVIVEKNGCPVDTDKDGVADYIDECAETLEGLVVNDKGCELDSDNDKVVDSADKCPNTPEGLSVDKNGCSKKIILGLHFKNNSSKIKRQSYTMIQKYAKFLKENPAYNVEIIGHTDSIGDEKFNQKLSLSRANTVKQAILEEGVDESRITTSGKGEFEPIQDNRTEDGRKANRRIEAILTLKK